MTQEAAEKSYHQTKVGVDVAQGPVEALHKVTRSTASNPAATYLPNLSAWTTYWLDDWRSPTECCQRNQVRAMNPLDDAFSELIVVAGAVVHAAQGLSCWDALEGR